MAWCVGHNRPNLRRGCPDSQRRFTTLGGADDTDMCAINTGHFTEPINCLMKILERYLLENA
jgi:hypothetical protein